LSTHLFIPNYLRDLDVLDKKHKVQGGQGECIQSGLHRVLGVKINVDTSVAKEGVGGAVAAVCRSKEGTFLGAASLTIQGINDPSSLEAIACREALVFA
jgi:hypothetical protein